jgi:hypothetical protein
MFSTFVTELIQITSPSKYRDIYISICQRGAERGINRKQLKESLGYVEGHHFIPKCVTKEYATEQHNIVFLTAREHFICHYLLCKIFKQTEHYFSLLSAFGKMSNIAPSMKHNRYMNSHLYEHFRKNVSSLMSQLKKGKLRIKREGITKEILKGDVNLYLADGWEIGAASTEEARLSRIAANKKRTGFIWMHFTDSEKSFQVLKDQKDNMLAQGAKCGRVFTQQGIQNMTRPRGKSRGILITNDIQTKKVTAVEADILLTQGWRRGRHHKQTKRGGFARSGTVYFNDGVKNFRLLPHEAAARSLVPGRIKNPLAEPEDI